MADGGLLLGLAQGLREGISGYMQAKQQRDEMEDRKRRLGLLQQQQQANLMEKGLIQSPEGQLEWGPEMKAQRAMQQAENDTSSSESQLARQQHRLAYQKLGYTPEEAMQAVPDDATAAQLKGESAKGLLSALASVQSAKYRASAIAAGREGAAGAKSDKEANAQIRHLQDLAQTSRGQPAVQQAEKDLYSASKVDRLIAKYGDPNKMDPTAVKVLMQEVGKIASGGQATQGELEAITPHTMSSDAAALLQKFKNEPTPANASKFINTWAEYARDVGESAKDIIKTNYSNIFDPYQEEFGEHPRFKSLRNQYIGRFDKSGQKQKSETGGLLTPSLEQKPSWAK